ncbi:MAG: AraC family transcriptional regulator [Ruminococcaceae bacterium]|nr:AraC family transcriptional regulator [Oscillospiraceae bacterium]
MKKATEYVKTKWEPMTDVSIPRSPDITSFHFSLDRIFGKGYDFAGESHPFYEIVYVLSGIAGITAGDKFYTLSAGQCLMHTPDEFHRIRAEENSEPHVINLSFHADRLNLPEDGRIFEPSDSLREEFIEISTEIREGLHNSDITLLAAQRVRLERWLLLAFRNGHEDGVSTHSGALCYAEIVRLMGDHISENLQAGDIAKMSRMSLSKLKKIFANYAGMGVSRYFTEMKIRRAAEMLRAGARVGETAAALGYADQNYFNTVFRRVMGVPPGKYRQRS